ncbi:MAG: S9 family peptidase [Planctomycetes bacterium]|nr:S9 family peptidase [Planctomycetota bacterium]
MIGRHIAHALVIWIVLFQSSAKDAKAKRGMTVDDVLSIENLGSIVLSPDGDWAAVAIQRSKRDTGFFCRTRLGGDDRADIWLVSLSTGERRRITNGAANNCGYWSPSWSADGEKLAMLSSEGNDNAHLFVWTRRDSSLARVDKGGVHVGAAVSMGPTTGFGYTWVDNNTLVAVFVPPGARPFDFGGDQESQVLASRAWKAMEQGLEPSVSILDSGAGARKSNNVAIVKTINIVQRQSTHITDLAMSELSAPQVSIAPDGVHAVVFETSPSLPPAPASRMKFGETNATRAGIIKLTANPSAPRWIEAFDHATLDSVLWSPDGKRLAALEPMATGSADRGIFLIDLDSGAVRRVLLPNSPIQQFMWLDAKRLVAQISVGGMDAVHTPRNDWWLLSLDVDGKCIVESNLTQSLPEAPASLTISGSESILAVVADALWHVDTRGAAVNLTKQMELPVRAICPRQLYPNGATSAELLVKSADGAKTLYYMVTAVPRAPSNKPVQVPSTSASVDAYWPSNHTIVFNATEENGVFAWAHNLSNGKVTRLAALNEHVAEVTSPKKMFIDYNGVDGAALHAIVLLPTDYEAGKRYPVLTWVYAGTVFRNIDAEKVITSKFSDNSLNLLPLLARGYVVLMPSMPLAPEGKASDPMIDLPKGVLPAVDRLIELGIADPDRLAVGGHSYGGYSTYSMITYTNRFKAAIAAAGASNLVSSFGTFDARFRYGDSTNEGISRMRWIEGGQGRMGAPPEEDLARYLRNSPINYTDRVQTPLLIIQGDLDFVPISQGEEFYSSLYRQGKRARFLRYFGESHSIESPANTKHMWNEIFNWLDTYIGPRAAAGVKK